MVASINYTTEQYEIITELQDLNIFDAVTTRFLVLMYTNNYARTKDELVGILCEYSGLSNKEDLIKSIDECISVNLIKTITRFDTIFCLQDDTCRETFLSKIPESIRSRLVTCRDNYLHSERVSVEGILSGGTQSGAINGRFRMLLKDAQREILLPMFNTSASNEMIEILKERANAGVKIKILLADYDKVVSKIRQGKKSTIKEWADPLGGLANIEIRIYTKLEYGNIYSSVIVDRRFCRMSVFDVKREKSSQGTLINCSQSDGEDLNLIRLMLDRFDTIWRASTPYNRNKVLSFIMEKRIWLVLISVLASICYNMVDDLVIKEWAIFFGTAAGMSFIQFIAPKVKNYFSNLLNKLNR